MVVQTFLIVAVVIHSLILFRYYRVLRAYKAALIAIAEALRILATKEKEREGEDRWN